MAQKIRLKKSNVVDKTPVASTIDFGELAVNYASGTGKAFLAAKKFDGTLAKFHEDAYNDATYAKKSAVSTLQSDVTGIKSTYALSATVKSEISALTQTIEDNEYVTALALTNADERISALEAAASGIGGEYLTIASASSIVNTLNSAINTAQQKADSAYNRDNATSATVKAGYWTSATTESKIGEAKNAAVTSAYTAATAYTSDNYLTKASAGTMYTNITSSLANYAKTADVNTQIGAASARSVNSAVSYTNAQIGAASARTIASSKTYADTTFLTKASAGTMYANLALSDTALSNRINLLSGTVSGNYATKVVASGYAVTAQENAITTAKGSSNDASTKITIYGARKYTDEKVTALSGNVVTAISNANSNATTAINKANSAFNYTDAVSATVKAGYWTSATTESKIGEAKNAAVTSAYTASTAYTSNNYVKNTTYTSYTGNVSSTLQGLQTGINTVSGNVTSLSGNVVSYIDNKLSTVYVYKGSVANYSNLPESGKVIGYVYNVVNANGSTPAGTNYAWNGSSWDALGGSFDMSWVASSGAVSNLSNAVNELKTGLSASVVTNYATHTEVGNASSHTLTSAVTSASSIATEKANAAAQSALTRANAYTDGKTSAITTMQSDISTLKQSAVTINNKLSNYATHAEVNTASGNAITSAITSAKSYGDATFLTKASAGTMYSNVTGMFAAYAKTADVNAQIGAASARSVNSAVSYTNSQVGAASARTVASSKTYADTTFLTKASAGTMYTNITSSLADYAKTADVNTQVANASARSVNSAVTYVNGQVGAASARTIASSKTYADTTFLTKASAGTMYTNVTSMFNDYMKTTAVTAQIAAASGNAVNISKSYTNTQVGAASARTVASSKTYADATFLTKASAGTMYSNITSQLGDITSSLSNYALSSTVKTALSSLEDEIEENEEVTAGALNDLNNRMDSLSGSVENNYLTKASAGTMYNNITSTYAKTSDVNTQVANASARSVNSAVSYTNAQVAAASARTVTSSKTYADTTFLTKASAGTMYSNVTGMFGDYMKTTAVTAQIAAASGNAVSTSNSYTNTQVAAASARTVASSKTYADTTFLTKASAGTMYSNVTGMFGDYMKTTAVTAQIAAASGNAVNAANSYTNTQIGAASARTVASSKTYADTTFLTKASAGTMYSNITSTYAKTSDVNTQIANASARSVNSAVSYTNVQVGAASARTVASSKTYADTTFLTKASGGTMYTNLNNNISNVNTALTAFSATVVNTYATDATASEYAAAAYANAMDYTDSKITDIGIGSYLTMASAGTMYNNITSTYAKTSDMNTQVAAASARSVNSAVTYANGQVAAASARTIASSKTYADTTFLTKASAGTMYSTLSNNISSVDNKVTGLSASVVTKLTNVYDYRGSVNNYSDLPASGQVNGYVYNVVNANGNTPAGTNYAWNGSSWDALGGTVDLSGYLTKASAGTMYTNVTSMFNDYMKTTAVTAQIAAASGNAVSTSNSYTNTQVGAASARTVASSKTYADTTFLTKASAGTMYSNITGSYAKTSDVNTQIGAASARSVNSAVTYVNGQVGAASARTVASSKTYADTTFLTKASGGTMYTNLNSSISNVNTALTAFSATVVNNYATETEASEYAAAALGNAMAYTDSKITDIGIGSYLTMASAGTMYNNITSTYAKTSDMNTQVAAASARSVNSAVSYTNAQVGAASARTIASSKTYADTTFLTKASAGTMYSNVTGMFGDYMKTTAVTAQIAAASGNAVTAANSYTNTQVAAASARTVSSSKTYADTTFLTKASAGTMYSNITGAYAKTSDVNTQIGAASARSVNSAVSYTNAQIGAASARTIASSKTYADTTFLTKASGGTMYSNVTNSISNLSGGVISDYMLKKSYVASGTTHGRVSVTIPGITEYFDGLTIHVRFGTSYYQTYPYGYILNVNGLGDRFVYLRYNSIMTSHLPQWAEVTLVYRDVAGNGYTSPWNYGTIVSGTTYKNGWIADYDYYSDSDSRTVAIYERRYAGSRLTRYQIIGIDKDERLQPLTKVDSGDYNTGANKPVNTVGFRPERFFYRNTTGIVAAGSVETAQIDADHFYITTPTYTFNSTLSAYRAVYLRGNYNASENLFYLNSGGTSFYTQVPTNTANITLSSYFTSGDYYIYLGATYSSNNYFELSSIHELFYFDGTNLIRQSTYYADQKVVNVNSDIAILKQSAATLDGKFVKKAGDTMTGVLTMKGNLYNDQYAGALNMNNSNIYGLNSLYTADASDAQSEGIHFYRTSTAVDTFRMANGKMLFTPNRPLSGTGTEYEVYHAGNASSALLTRASAGTMYSNITSMFTYYTGTSGMNAQIAAASARTIASSKTYVDVQIAAASARTIASSKTYVDTTFLTKASGGTMYGNLNSSISNVNTALTAFSATVINTYATDATASQYAASAYANAMDYTDSKISDIGIGNYLTKASAGTMYSTLSNNITGVNNKVTGLSASVVTKLTNVYTYMGSVTNYADLPATGHVNGYVYNVVNANGNTPPGTNYAWNGSAWDALGGTVDLSGYLTKSSAGTMYSNITSMLTYYTGTSGMNAQIAAASARTFASAKTYVDTQIAAASARTIASSKTYADTTFLTKASGGTMYNNLNSSITSVNNKLTGFSATVLSDYATETEASDYAAAALGNAMAYTDSKITDIGIGNYLTKASAGTMYSNITSNYAKTSDMNTQVAAASARSVNSAVTYVNGQVGAASARSVNSAVTYVNGQVGAASARSVNSAVTYVDTQIASAKTYVDKNFVSSVSINGNNVRVTKNGSNSDLTVPYALKAKDVSGATFGWQNYGEHNANNIKSNGMWYYSTGGPTTSLGATTNDGALYSQAYSTSWVGQIAQDYRNGRLFVRGLNNGSWTSWLKVWDSGNLNPANFSLSSSVKTRFEMIEDTIEENEEVASAALVDLDERLTNLSDTIEDEYATTANLATLKTQVTKTLTITKNGGSSTAYTGLAAVTAATTDKMVEQISNTAANYRPLLLGNNNNAAQGSIPTTTSTAATYFNKNVYAQPSTGELGATQMKVGGHVTLQYNSTTESLDFIFS